MRCFIDHHRTRLPRQLRKYRLPFFFIHRQKRFKCKSSGCLPRRDQCIDRRTRPRHRNHFDSCLIALLRDFLSRIGNSRRSGIRNHCNIHAFQKLAYKHLCFFIFIMFMIASHRRLDVEMIEQLDTVSRVLRRDQIYLSKQPHRPVGHILQIADWRCNQIQCSCHLSVSISCQQILGVRTVPVIYNKCRLYLEHRPTAFISLNQNHIRFLVCIRLHHTHTLRFDPVL